MEEEKYAVYAHVYEGSPFYVGSGRIYETKTGLLRGRPYQLDFKDRSPEWFNHCNGETEKIEVDLLFITNDKQLARDREAEITRYYMELEMPLVNIFIGNKRSEEWKKQHSIAMSGKNHPFYGKTFSEEHKRKLSESRKGGKCYRAQKVKITNNENGERINFSCIQDAHEFIAEKGYKRKYDNFVKKIRKGSYNFNEYTIERIE